MVDRPARVVAMLYGQAGRSIRRPVSANPKGRAFFRQDQSAVARDGRRPLTRWSKGRNQFSMACEIGHARLPLPLALRSGGRLPVFPRTPLRRRRRRWHEQKRFHGRVNEGTGCDSASPRNRSDAGLMNDRGSPPGPDIPLASSLAGFQPLSAAESKIVAHLSMGDFDRLGDGLRPEREDPARVVRAEFLRFLILGKDEFRLHEKGLRLTGAWVSGILDLEGCRVPRDIGLKDCHFDASPVLRSAIIDNLFLDGSSLPGLQADRLEARGCLSLRGAIVTGEIRLSGARTGDSIEADGATLALPDGIVLEAAGLEARGGVQLRGANVRGGINLSGGRLVGDVNAVGARIERPGEVVLNLDGMVAGGDLAAPRGHHLAVKPACMGPSSVVTSIAALQRSSSPAAMP